MNTLPLHERTPPPSRPSWVTAPDAGSGGATVQPGAVHDGEIGGESCLGCAAFEAQPTPCAIVDASGTIVRANTAWRTLASNHPDSDTALLVGASMQNGGIRRRIQSIAGPGVFEQLRALLAGRIESFEGEARVASGSTVRHFLVRVVAVVIDGARYAIVAHTDVTAMRETERRIRQLSQAVEQSPVSIVITDTEGCIQYVNPKFEQITGYSAKEAIGQNPRLLKSGLHPAGFYRDLWSTISSGRVWRGELSNRTRGGDLFWEQASISPLRDESGAITHYIAVKEDITERKKVETAVAWAAAIVDNSSDICVVKDLDLRVLVANDACARAVGRAHSKELEGMTAAEIFNLPASEEPVRGIIEADRQAQKLPPGERIRREVSISYPDGRSHTFLSSCFPVFDNHDNLIATANISTDITDRKLVEAELLAAKEAAVAASSAKGVFLANMSHELRTPLNVINGLSATLLEQHLGGEHNSTIQLIHQSGQSLLGIIEEILEFSRLQAGRLHLEPRPCELGAVVFRAINMAAERARQKGIDLRYRIGPEVPAEVVADARRLQQVLVNLLSNAVKFTEVGHVELRLDARSRADGQWELVGGVHDTGIGIEPVTLANLFQPFSQADGSITRRFGGSGLGLAITRSFLRLMGGDVSAESTSGRGSTFVFRAVVGATNHDVGLLASYGHPSFEGRRIRVAVPDPAREDYLTTLASAWGMDAEPAAPGRALPEGGHAYDVSLIDVDVLPPGLREHRDRLVEQADASHVVWISRQPQPAADASSVQPPTLPWPVSPDDLARALIKVLPGAEPVVPAAAPDRTEIQARPLGQRLPLRVLAADDVYTNRQVLEIIFTHLGYEVDLVENGAEALEQINRRTYDLVMLDVQMPVMDGLSAAREICRRYPDADKRPKMVAVTANAMPGDREACLDAGMDDYLSKPVVPKQIEQCFLCLFDRGATDGFAMTPATTPTPLEASVPWIDREHIAAITCGTPDDQVVGMLAQLQQAFVADFNKVLPRIIEACSTRDRQALIGLVHGLKGGALMLGWKHLGEYCLEVLTALRAGTFERWPTLAVDLERLHGASIVEMGRFLESLATDARKSS